MAISGFTSSGLEKSIDPGIAGRRQFVLATDRSPGLAPRERLSQCLGIGEVHAADGMNTVREQQIGQPAAAGANQVDRLGGG